MLWVVAEQHGTVGGVGGDCGPVAPVRRWTREQCLHRLRVVVRQIIIDRTGRHRARPDQGQRREHTWVVECGDLRDHPTNLEAAEVCGGSTERANERRRVGGEIAERVAGRLWIDGGRAPAVAQVVPHHPTSADGESFAESVRPGEHRGAADEQHKRIGIATEALHAEFNAVGPD